MRLLLILAAPVNSVFVTAPVQARSRLTPPAKDEINRQTQKADAAQHAKKPVRQPREALVEKIKNVRPALTADAPAVTTKGLSEKLGENSATLSDGALRRSVAAALNNLNS